MRNLGLVIGAALLASAASASADVAAPEGDRGFRYVYPPNVSPEQAAKLHRDDLKQIAAEGAKLQVGDGGTLTDDHRAYLETRREVVERRYMDALTQMVSFDR